MISLPSKCFKKVEDANIFISTLGDNAKNLNQDEINYYYNKWSPEEQKKFIWKDGIMPNFNQENNFQKKL